jgi:hypothetical protein
MAFSMLSACLKRFMCLNNIRELNNKAVGLARPFPAMSGADPWTASKMEASFPMLPEGVRPRPPIKPAHMSDKISPYKLGMTMTVSAYGAGSCTIYCKTNMNQMTTRRRSIGIHAHPQAYSVQKVLVVNNVGVVLSNVPACLQEHSIGHLHDGSLVYGGNLVPAVLRGVVESVTSDTLGSLVGDQLDGLDNTGNQLSKGKQTMFSISLKKVGLAD